jgi:hypothetical protein
LHRTEVGQDLRREAEEEDHGQHLMEQNACSSNNPVCTG